MLWIAVGCLLTSYAHSWWSKVPARIAVALGRAGYLRGVQVPAVALALFAVSPVVCPLAATFIFFATRPSAAIHCAGYIGVEYAEPEPVPDAHLGEGPAGVPGPDQS